ncbi:MAG: hypothetical protein JO322_15110 [Candidatus Eremiobacteraeota bacterium]|nr:hypothetical protein [Candidatus Eremiobacteraeota bacterium]
MIAIAPGPALAKHPSAAPTASPTPPPEDPAVTAVARREFVAWQAGVVTSARYADQAQSALTADHIATTSKELGAAGTLERTDWIGPVIVDDAPPGTHGYWYKMTCENTVVYERLIIAPDGKIDGIMFRDKPPQ